MDVKSAYLNAPLNETIYMKAPRGVLKPGEEGKSTKAVKGVVWTEAGRKRLVHGDDEGVHQRVGF